MAIELKELGLLSLDDQESILKDMCKDYHPIQVNDTKYMIPSEVNELIDDLFVEITILRVQLKEKSIGEKKN